MLISYNDICKSVTFLVRLTQSVQRSFFNNLQFPEFCNLTPVSACCSYWFLRPGLPMDHQPTKRMWFLEFIKKMSELTSSFLISSPFSNGLCRKTAFDDISKSVENLFSVINILRMRLIWQWSVFEVDVLRQRIRWCPLIEPRTDFTEIPIHQKPISPKVPGPIHQNQIPQNLYSSRFTETDSPKIPTHLS